MDSRPLREYTGIRRRRICRGCGFRWTTYEYQENDYVALGLEKHRAKVDALAKMILEMQGYFNDVD
jgi:transcriptional regulator NrdR family protein